MSTDGPAATPDGAAATPAVAAHDVVKRYGSGDFSVEALRGVSVDFPRGQFAAVMGPSGSGKSTLLNLIAGLDRPTSGSAKVAGNDLGSMSDGDLARFRSRNIGFIFQAYNLMPVLTALENVELPLLLTKLSSADRRKRAQTALRVTGLEDRHPKTEPLQASGALQTGETCADDDDIRVHGVPS